MVYSGHGVVKKSAIVNAETDGTGRPGQRRRTRKAIVDATVELLSSGSTPTVAEIADAAEVSRRTVYLYFPTLEQLLIDATLGALSQRQVDEVIETPEIADDAGARVEAIARALQSMSPEAERLGRSLIRLTVEPPADGGADLSPRRGYRRVEWIERALSPLHEQIDGDRFQRLVFALTMVVGWEALIVQRDVCGLTAHEGEDLSAWAARALLQATLAEISTD
jgi:AcrR family transcriptional regulator